MNDFPVVCIFGAKDVKLMSEDAPPFETRELDCRCYDDDAKLNEILAKDRPGAIVSVGKTDDFKNLLAAPFFIRKMWLHFDDMETLRESGQKVFMCYLHNAINDRDDIPLVSVFTPTYKSGERIFRPFLSLLSQTYKDFEWVIVDDSDDEDETFKMLTKMAEKDYRIRVYKADRRSGRIGNVKRTACGLARGKFLVELDHDDELTPKALEWIVQAFEAHPEVGALYTDGAECFEDGTPVNYPVGWGFGYGKYRTEYHGGMKFEVIDSPNLNPKTIRHIVAAPNHARAWRKSFYDSTGHRDGLAVADDYELILRSFLFTRVLHIPRMAYLQYRNSQGNAHQFRNQEIQRLVRNISTAYDEKIHKRFEELGVDDFVYRLGKNMSFFQRMNIPNPEVEQHCTITFEPKD